MTNGPTHTWLAAHLYYNEPWEEFLTKSVEPYISSVIQAGVAEQYFFIRYWDRGPHIRLRFKGETTVIEQIFRPNLVEHFENYFEDRPSKRTNPNYPLNFPDEFKWLPNNSVQFANYEPEYKRYGGPVGVKIAEKQFQHSSDITLNYIKQKGFKWSYDDALGAAIKLHLSFVHTMGFDLDAAISFFRMIFYNWLPKSFRFYTKSISKEEYKKLSFETIDSFSKSFEMQKAALVPFHRALWEGISSESEFEEVALNKWILQNKLIKQELAAAFLSQQIDPREDKYQLPVEVKGGLEADQELLWNFYADYIHMTNNRLGILNKDEGYLGFLIMQSLQMIQKNNAETSEYLSHQSENFEKIILDTLF